MASFMYNMMSLRRSIPGASALVRACYSRQYPEDKASEVFGLRFRSPLGLSGMDKSGGYLNQLSDYGFSFVCVGPPELSGKDGYSTPSAIISNIRKSKPRTIIAASLEYDFLPSFSMLYDFVDLFIVEMTEHNSDLMEEVLDELVGQRLCYDRHIPIILHLRAGINTETESIINFSRLSGIDGFGVDSIEELVRLAEITSRRVPIIAWTTMENPATVPSLIGEGASLVVMEPENGKFRKGAAKKAFKLLNVK